MYKYTHTLKCFAYYSEHMHNLYYVGIEQDKGRHSFNATSNTRPVKAMRTKEPMACYCSILRMRYNLLMIITQTTTFFTNCD